MQNKRKRQAVILPKKDTPHHTILYKLTNSSKSHPKNEISYIFILHFSPTKPIINPIISGKDDGYDPLFLHDEGTVAK